jgi:acyl carrier protein
MPEPSALRISVSLLPHLYPEVGSVFDDFQQVIAVVCDVGGISRLNPDDDIYDAGFSSINALQLLMELESAFQVSIPDDEFIQARSPRALNTIIERLKQEQPV